MLYAKNCVKPSLSYYQDRFTGELSNVIAVFKTVRSFLPSKVRSNQKLLWLTLLRHSHSWTILSFLMVSKRNCQVTFQKPNSLQVLQNTNVLPWWKKHPEELPKWCNAALKVALVQPSSAAAEHVFSVLKSSYGQQQELTLQDHIECSLMLQYNCKSTYCPLTEFMSSRWVQWINVRE